MSRPAAPTGCWSDSPRPWWRSASVRWRGPVVADREQLRADLVAARSEAEHWERAARLAVAAHVAPEQVDVVLEVLYEQAAGEAMDAEGDRREVASVEAALRAVLSTGDVCTLADCRQPWCWLGREAEGSPVRALVRRLMPERP